MLAFRQSGGMPIPFMTSEFTMRFFTAALLAAFAISPFFTPVGAVIAESSEADKSGAIKSDTVKPDAIKQKNAAQDAAIQARLDALEQQLAAIKNARATTSNTPSGNTGSGNQFNPAISLILQGTYADYSIDPEDYGLAGFAVGEEAGLRPEGFSLAESELSLSANIDDQWYGQATLALENEDGETVTALEEAYVETTALPAGFSLKLGRFLSGIGYLNHHHSHTDSFISRPLVYQTLIQHHYGDDGAQLRYVAPTDLFLEVGTEYLRGGAYPAEGASRDGKAVNTVFVHVGGDVGIEHSWLAGVSQLRGETAAGSDGFAGDVTLSVVDFTWKWSPDGNPKRGGLVLRTEWFADQRDGGLFDEEGNYLSAWDSDRDGYYAEALYRYGNGWSTGLRLDSISGDASAPGDFASGERSDSHSLVLSYQRSEFSQLRLQFSRFDTASGDRETGIWLQYLMALGAHGAHKF
jgi:hypothetical protein